MMTPGLFAMPPAELGEAADIRPAPMLAQPPAARRRSGAHAAQHLALGLLLAVCLLAPALGGGAAPALQMLFSLMIGIAALADGTSAFQRMHPAGRQAFALALALGGYALFQALPLPALKGGVPLSLPGAEILLNSLSLAPGESLLAAIRITGYALFFALMMRQGRSARKARAIALLLFAAIAVQAAWALASLHLAPTAPDSAAAAARPALAGAATGSFAGRNALAAHLSIGLLLGMALLSRPANGRHRIRLAALGLGVVLIAAALFATRSRMGVAAALAGMALLLAMRRSRLRPGAFLGAAAGLALIALLAVQSGFWDRLGAIGLDDESRLPLYGQVLGMIKANPLAGLGMGSFAQAYPAFHAPPVSAGFIWDRAHSSYLQLWAEAGLLFGSLPLVAGALLGRALWRRARRNAPGRSLATAALCALLAMALHSAVDFPLEIPANTYLLLALIALGLGPRHQRRTPPPAKGTQPWI